MRVMSKLWSYIPLNYLKYSMKNKFHKVLGKFIRESEDFTAAACTGPVESSAICLGKYNHVGAILFALEDFNRKISLWY